MLYLTPEARFTFSYLLRRETDFGLWQKIGLVQEAYA
jgi:hypothetical protein